MVLEAEKSKFCEALLARHCGDASVARLAWAFMDIGLARDCLDPDHFTKREAEAWDACWRAHDEALLELERQGAAQKEPVL